MHSRTAVVASSVGLHARPAAVFAKAAAAAGVPVTLAVAGRDPIDARSVLQVMTLGVEHGQEVTLSAEGDDAPAVLADLAGLLESDLDA
ncbi:hypothetical protein AFB00_25595 [Pseudonocardia sp. HH130630-07]|nr:hypothetical protein AFB00_25595 [Pseudonocardia sp. HH130630-07]